MPLRRLKPATVVGVVVLLALCPGVLQASGAVHWTYEGAEGPENWAKLSPDFALCGSGRNQSPIDIRGTLDAHLRTLRFNYPAAATQIVNNGHTVQVNFGRGDTIELNGVIFELKQVHFHAPSENLIRGKSYPLEGHFVHADAQGNLAVIGVMFKEGKANAALGRLWAQMPHKVGEPTALKARVLPTELLPRKSAYFRFSGSLTTPPCSEGVRWLVMKFPLDASREQIEAFEGAVHHHNNRPVQSLNARVVVE